MVGTAISKGTNRMKLAIRPPLAFLIALGVTFVGVGCGGDTGKREGSGTQAGAGAAGEKESAAGVPASEDGGSAGERSDSGGKTGRGGAPGQGGRPAQGGVAGQGGAASGGSGVSGSGEGGSGPEGGLSEAGSSGEGPEPGTCGDSAVDVNESCDDGNSRPYDGCSRNCQVEPGYVCPEFGLPCEPTVTVPDCGNGAIDLGETCDDGDANGDDGCSETCQREEGWSCAQPGQPCARDEYCGDGILNGEESCDDGNLAPGDCCSDICVLQANCVCTTPNPPLDPPRQECRIVSSCGDGQLDEGEDCDDGNAVDSDGCNNDCVTSGKVLWVAEHETFTGNYDTALDVAMDRDGNAVVVGTLQSEAGDMEAVVWKVSPQGEVLQSFTFQNPLGDDRLAAVAVNSQNQLALVGTRALPETEGGEPVDFIWYGLYDATDLSEMWSTVTDQAGQGTAASFDIEDQLYVGGSATGSGHGSGDVWVRRLEGSTDQVAWTNDGHVEYANGCTAQTEIPHHMVVHPLGYLLVQLAFYCADDDQTDCASYLWQYDVNTGERDWPGSNCSTWSNSYPGYNVPYKGGMALGPDSTAYLASADDIYMSIGIVPETLHIAGNSCTGLETLAAGAKLLGPPMDLVIDNRGIVLLLNRLGAVSRGQVSDGLSIESYAGLAFTATAEALAVDSEGNLYVAGQKGQIYETPGEVTGFLARLAP